MKEFIYIVVSSKKPIEPQDEQVCKDYEVLCKLVQGKLMEQLVKVKYNMDKLLLTFKFFNKLYFIINSNNQEKVSSDEFVPAPLYISTCQ